MFRFVFYFVPMVLVLPLRISLHVIFMVDTCMLFCLVVINSHHYLFIKKKLLIAIIVAEILILSFILTIKY